MIRKMRKKIVNEKWKSGIGIETNSENVKCSIQVNKFNRTSNSYETDFIYKLEKLIDFPPIIK